MNRNEIIKIDGPVEGLHVAAVRMGLEVPEVMLHPEERRELQLMRHEFRKKEFIVSRWLTRQLAENIHKNPEEIVIRKEATGMPVGKDKQRSYHLSISHTGDYVGVALSLDRRVGLDIEKIHRKISPNLRHRILHDDEQEMLKANSTVRIWTLKESVLKLIGLGLRQSMNEVIIYPYLNNSFRTEWKGSEIRIYPFQTDGILGAISIFE